MQNETVRITRQSACGCLSGAAQVRVPRGVQPRSAFMVRGSTRRWLDVLPQCRHACGTPGTRRQVGLSADDELRGRGKHSGAAERLHREQWCDGQHTRERGYTPYQPLAHNETLPHRPRLVLRSWVAQRQQSRNDRCGTFPPYRTAAVATPRYAALEALVGDGGLDPPTSTV